MVNPSCGLAKIQIGGSGKVDQRGGTMRSMNRRSFVKGTAAASLVAPWVTRNLLATPPSRVLRHASFGASGMAWHDIQAICSNPFVKLVAVAEVDLNHLADLKASYPEAKVYPDWRTLLDKEGRHLDSVNVSTPDHMHAAMALSAMQLGKHVYCEKPLAHDIHEVRALTRYAGRKRLVTQMGIQIHSMKVYRQAVALVHGGVIGKVREVHTWSNKQWGDLGPPGPAAAVPAGFDWDLWLGGCAARPFVRGHYHPFVWRKRLDFGTGTFGDMGCHIFDPVFEALALTAPLTVRSEGPPPDAWNWPVNCRIRYVFPGTRFTADKTVPVTWYDGDERPPAEIIALVAETAGGAARSGPEARQFEELLSQGSIIIGTEGVLHVPHIDTPRLFPLAKYAGYALPAAEDVHHWSEWAEACVSGGRTSTPFSYAGPLTEAVLLGSVAVRFPQTTLNWNASRLRFDNEKQANSFLRRRYRRGWRVSGL